MEQDESVQKGIANTLFTEEIQAPDTLLSTPFMGAVQAPDTLLSGVLSRLEQRKPFLKMPTGGLSNDELRHGLTHPQWEIRTAAVRTPGLLDEQGGQEALLQALHDEHRLVRASAVRALGQRGLSEQLLFLLQDEAWEVREMVVQVLGERNEIPTTVLLRMAQFDVNIQVREAAQSTLQQSNRQERAIPVLETIRPANMIQLKQAFWRPLLLLKSQVPILHKSTWFLGPIGGCMLFLICFFTHAASKEGLLIAMILAASAIGTAWIYNTEYDRGLELTLATPTSIRLLLFCRMFLVLGYNILLGGIISALMTLVYGGSFFHLMLLWLGPLLLLSSCSLLLSLLVGSLFASFTTLLFEMSQAVQIGVEQHFPTLYLTNFQDSLWQRHPATLLFIPLCIILVFIYVPGRVQVKLSLASRREPE
ncbi:MAG TPA: HEAT repeat domain-containing protein [Ktedonobacteraceae bacterium]|jgi:hypothetical protein